MEEKGASTREGRSCPCAGDEDGQPCPRRRRRARAGGEGPAGSRARAHSLEPEGMGACSPESAGDGARSPESEQERARARRSLEGRGTVPYNAGSKRSDGGRGVSHHSPLGMGSRGWILVPTLNWRL